MWTSVRQYFSITNVVYESENQQPFSLYLFWNAFPLMNNNVTWNCNSAHQLGYSKKHPRAHKGRRNNINYGWYRTISVIPYIAWSPLKARFKIQRFYKANDLSSSFHMIYHHVKIKFACNSVHLFTANLRKLKNYLLCFQNSNSIINMLRTGFAVWFWCLLI